MEMIDKPLPIVVCEGVFKQLSGVKEIINFKSYICIAIRNEDDLVFILGEDIDNVRYIRKFNGKRDAIKQLNFNIEGAITVASGKYNFEPMNIIENSINHSNNVINYKH